MWREAWIQAFRRPCDDLRGVWFRIKVGKGMSPLTTVREEILLDG